jgi:uncharacterized OB-fold protein
MTAPGSPQGFAGLCEHFWGEAGARRLALQRCADCGRHQHYPRGHCVHCHGRNLTWTTACGRARLHSHSVVERNSTPWFAERLPYVFALVDLEEGVRLTANIVGLEVSDIRPNMALTLTFTPGPDGRNLPQFTREDS